MQSIPNAKIKQCFLPFMRFIHLFNMIKIIAAQLRSRTNPLQEYHHHLHQHRNNKTNTIEVLLQGRWLISRNT